jgi:hypothetical protein
MKSDIVYSRQESGGNSNKNNATPDKSRIGRAELSKFKSEIHEPLLLFPIDQEGANMRPNPSPFKIEMH